MNDPKMTETATSMGEGARSRELTLPSVRAIVTELNEYLEAIGPSKEDIDVRLQVQEDGHWQVRVGDASYDTDHSGHWGASSVSGRHRMLGDLATVAAMMLSEVIDSLGEDGVDGSFPALEVEVEESGNSMAGEEQCLLWADREEAASDQTVLGSSWETPADVGRAYTIVCGSYDDVCAQLRAEGYKVIG